MYARTALIAFGLLLTGAASAAEIYTVAGPKMVTNEATGVVECSGGCTVVLSSALGVRITFEALDPNSENPVLNVPVLRINAQRKNVFEVSGKWSFRTRDNGSAELKADNIRILKAVSTF